uniref:VanZ family protein n=1 Tax=Roseihalotalea indica TaxID=2867963 RepID=A0AA49JK69_9BACT|nr:VanZ family protein [Tunicatimonas sp. TK19036]
MFWRFNFYTLVWMLVILALILMPGPQMPQLGTSLFSVDKLAHTAVFAILALLMIIGFAKQTRYLGLRNKAAKYALILSITYASVLESTQVFSEGRTIDAYDAIANTIGCVSGYGLFFALYKW